MPVAVVMEKIMQQKTTVRFTHLGSTHGISNESCFMGLPKPSFANRENASLLKETGG